MRHLSTGSVGIEGGSTLLAEKWQGHLPWSMAVSSLRPLTIRWCVLQSQLSGVMGGGLWGDSCTKLRVSLWKAEDLWPPAVGLVTGMVDEAFGKTIYHQCMMGTR